MIMNTISKSEKLIVEKSTLSVGGWRHRMVLIKDTKHTIHPCGEISDEIKKLYILVKLFSGQIGLDILVNKLDI